MSVQIVLALAAKYLHDRGINRPVKVVWSKIDVVITSATPTNWLLNEEPQKMGRSSCPGGCYG